MADPTRQVAFCVVSQGSELLPSHGSSFPRALKLSAGFYTYVQTRERGCGAWLRYFLQVSPGHDAGHICLHSIGQNSVSWPCLAAKESRK